jgi:hypothetical protein
MIEGTVVLPSAYLAPISYYCRLLAYRNVLIEQCEHYIKQTYRNRCVIATESGPLSLTVPVEKVAANTPVSEIRISDHGNWRHLHWQALMTAYDKTPYFEYYADDFRPFYEKKYEFLIDYNEALRRLICDLLSISPNVSKTSTYTLYPDAEDCRLMLTPKSKMRDDYFVQKQYYQVFAMKNGFLPDMSIVDLLFNMGPESIYILKQSFVAKVK